MTREKILIASLILFFVNVPAFADDELDTIYSKGTLRGLQGVYVVIKVQDLSATTIQQHGLTKEQLQTDTEINLRAAGIKVIPTQDELLKEPGNPLLYVYVVTRYEPGLKGFVIHCQVELRQLVQLERAPTLFDVSATWSKAGMTLIGEESAQNIRGFVKDLVDKFINAYLTANPKK
jgi:hypothetical protein